MMAIIMSIKPKWCELIASGKKTVEVRKTKPKLETPFKCYIYETQGRTETPFVDEEGHHIFKCRGQVIGEFVCDRVFALSIYYSDVSSPVASNIFPFTCLTDRQILDYLGNGGSGYGWHISDLEIYDKPRELSGFHKVGYQETKDGVYGWTVEEEKSWQIKRAPQSWMYVDLEEEKIR